MNTTGVFSEAESHLGRYDLLRHPFYEAWSDGALTRKDLSEYAAEYYHHVAAFPTYLSALHSRLPDGLLRRAVLRNLCEEEIDGIAHSELWLDFAEGMGADRQAAKSREPIPEIRELIGVFRSLAESPAAALAGFYAYESQVPRISEQKARGLALHYGADARACRYFEVHRLMDRHHAKVWRKELAALLEREPASADEALRGGQEAARALWCALDGIEEARRMRAGNGVEGNAGGPPKAAQ